MKKVRRQAFTPGAVTSMAELEKEGAKDVFAQQAHQQKSEITLNLGNEKEVTFKLITIQPEDIEKKTTVFSGNGRIQEALNTFALRDLIPSVRKHGMTFPAIGRQLPDGRYEALDGSRRRATCIITKRPYYMYITTSPLVDEKTARYLSEIGNVYKQLSQYEQGKQYTLLIDKGVSPVEIARQEGISKVKVYQARDAYLLPKEFYQAHASGFDLGRPRINAYRTMWSQAQELKFDKELLEFIKSLKPEKLAANISVKDIQLERAVKQTRALMLEQSEFVDNELAPVIACENLAQLMELPEMVELLGLSETVIRVIDNAARAEITEAFATLAPTPEVQETSESVFTGRESIVTSTTVKDGMKMTFRKLPESQMAEIKKMVAQYLAAMESTTND
ncbi:ParB N-terminal domain-containing protein [Oceanisphaera pacifica]|uniref:ParB N-terminal domain-containing protein n=1 Tax=Oceanisphaera pacifica TaxID=2818389 RepID=A0ABS3NJF1_9GAMM|nr:ParB N-terminal domain-containing protein [Oceanisphaera pacifica]MBO1520442.1 ParB N-terminal domain-containing protein [Oceanisphaera pacifica]